MSEIPLPPSWVNCRLGDVVDYGSTQKAEPSEIPKSAWVLELEDIEKDTSKVLQRLTFEERQSKSTKNHFQVGDVLYGKLRPYLNKVVHVDADGYCTTEIIPLKPSENLNGGYLFHWLKHPDFLNYVTAASHGLNMPRLGTEAGKDAPFVLAPINEQKRIADKLDAVFARLDACRERLDRVPGILKRFRHALLQQATSGELTKDWRAAQQNESKWVKLRLREIGEFGRGKSRHRPRNDPRLYGGPYPFIQTGDIAQSGGRISSHTQTYSEIGLAQSKLWPSGTLCITIAANIADTAILEYPACFPDSVVGFIANSKKIMIDFAKWIIDINAEHLETFAPATAQKNINITILDDIEFLIPSLNEQREIVDRVKALLSYADRLETHYTTVRNQVNRLTSALLTKAFRGQLVLQDPNDEPAEALLARMRAMRLESAAAPKRPRGRPRIGLPRAPKEKSKMTKSRNDQDVRNKGYLAAFLRMRGGPMPVGDLFRLSELPLTDFYKQLAWEIDHGHIKDDSKHLAVI